MSTTTDRSTSDPCEVVTERVALGEPLGDLAEHAATCARCRRLAALPTEVGAAHPASEPADGFSARITAGAQRRIVVRRRRRIGLALASVAAATALVAFAVTRRTADEQLPATVSHDKDPAPEPPLPAPPADDVSAERDLAYLTRAASTHVSARWHHIERSLAPYRTVFKGVSK
jgi:hypothetical protein